MGLPEISVKRPVTISMVFLGLCLMGWVSLVNLPVELMPNVSFGNITIIIEVRGGIPSSEIEERVTKLIEEAVGGISHLTDILSISKEGEATIILEFEPGTNMDFAALEVRENFARIRSKLPREIERPVIAQYEYMDVPIMILAVTGKDSTPEELRRLVDETVKERISRVEGVAKIEVSGGRERKILVEVDQGRLMAYSLSIHKVIEMLNLNNLNLLAGDIEREKDKYLVRAIGELKSIREIEEIGIATTRVGSIIRLKDVATVEDSYLEPTGFARMNVKPVVSLYVLKESTANTVKVATYIQEELEKIRADLPAGVEITSTFNQAQFVKKAIDTVKVALLYGAVLAILILLVFLRNVKSTLVIALTIPLSVLVTFSLMLLRKITLNVMTLSGLALGIGMLVDNAIVVLENIFKKRENRFLILDHQGSEGGPEDLKQKAKETAVEGAREVGLAIFASTVTTVIVFLPLVFVNKEIQMLYSGLGLTVSFSLIVSLFIALTLVPMLTSKIVPHPTWSFGLSARKKKVRRAKMRFKSPFFSQLKKRYRRILALVIKYRYGLVGLVFLLFGVALFGFAKLDKEFIGIAEQNKFTIFIQLPTGARLEIADQTVKKVEQLLAQVPEVKTATARVEPWSSKVYVELRPLSQRKRSTAEVIASLRPEVENIQPAFIYFEEPQEVGTKEVLLEIYGYNYDILKELAIQIASKLDAIPQLTDVKIRMREGRPEMRLLIDKQRAALFGLSVEEIAGTIHAQMRGLVATRYHPAIEPLVRLKAEGEKTTSPLSDIAKREQSEMIEKKLNDFRATRRYPGEAKEVETIARLQERYRRTFDDLHRLTMVTPYGDQVYLNQLTDFKFDLGPSEIWRKNKFRMVQVSANTGGMPLGTAAGKIKEALSGTEFPKDYFWRIGGNYDKMLRNQKELSFALWLTIVLIFLVLSSLFESYYQPFIIMSSVPLATIGVVGILTLTHKPISIGSLLGMIMLAGIVVNSAIILVDRINQLRKSSESRVASSERKNDKKSYSLLRGTQTSFGSRCSLLQSVVTASQDRLRPILMTTSTTILGLLPMALDRSEAANLWSPLAITVIGGLISSTALTLFIVPSIYVIFEDIKRALQRIMRRRHSYVLRHSP